MNDDGVALIDDEPELLIIKRVGFETIGVGGFVGNIGGVALPDDDNISDIEFERSGCCVASGKN